MTHAQKIQIENLSNLKNQLNYTSDLLINQINEMEDWEVKEFISVAKDYKEEYNGLFLHIHNNF